MTDTLLTPTRRQTLAGMLAAPLAACASEGSAVASAPVAPSPSSLNALAAAKGRRFGSCIGSRLKGTDGGAVQNPDYARIVAAECGVIVPENEFKWQFTRPDAEKFAFERMDAIIAWAQANSLPVRGHTLLWHRPKWFPNWLNNYDYGATPAREAARLLTTHITAMTARYNGAIKSYDVVNEAIDHDTNGLIETSMSRAMGSAEAVLDLAFHTARAAAPGAELVYNDYMSWEPDQRAHCRDVLRLLEGFRKRGTPVDTLGIQSHIQIDRIDPATGNGPYVEGEWRRFLDEAVAMGYKLVITEFDVKDRGLPADIPLRDAKVADYARRYFDVMLSYPQLGDILAWGMVDKFCWLQGFAKRADGLEVRCCPYDSAYQPKPLRAAIAQSLAGAVQAG